MKKLFYLLAAMACTARAEAQVGIGTTAPNTNTVLDIFSTNKGILIPRILDTVNVSNPMEGLIIYNKNTKSPYYYNGTQWLSLGGRLPGTLSASTDSISYEVTGTGFSTNTQAILSLSFGAANPTSITGGTLTPGGSSLSTINLMKEFDVNSKSFNLATLLGTKFASIEIKFFATGSLIPYLSYRLKNIIFEGYQTSVSAGGGSVIESISVAFENYGFKDWVNNFEFGYNVLSKSVTAY